VNHCKLCQKGILKLQTRQHTVLVYDACQVPVGLIPVSVCTHCNEEFIEYSTTVDAKKKALKKLYVQYKDQADHLPGTVAGWMRITMLISRDDLTRDVNVLKEKEQQNQFVPELVARKLLWRAQFC